EDEPAEGAGGAADPFAGVVNRTGGLGYLPQDPRLDGVDDQITAVRHIISGRGFDEAMTRIEKLRLQMEEDPSERAVARFTRAKAAQLQAKEIDRLQTLVDRFGAKASKASMAHSIEKRIVRLEHAKVEAPKAGRSVHVTFPPPPPPGRVVMEGEGLGVRYGPLE